MLCIACATNKPLENFYKHKRHKDGYNHTCKECRKAEGGHYRAANAEAIRQRKRAWEQSPPGKASKAQSRKKKSFRWREYHKQYRFDHEEELRVKKQAYRAEHKEEEAQRNKTYRESHPDEIKQTSRRYYRRHPELCQQRNKQWKTKNPEKALQIARAASKTRRARKIAAPINDFTAAQWEEMKNAFNHRCAYCHKKCERLTQDHITPLSEGGSHTVSNIVPACRSCNAKKHTGPPLVPVQPLFLTLA